jgi:hypothetical protein
MLKYGIVCGIFSISFMIFSCKESEIKDKLIEVSTSGCYRSCPVLDLQFKQKTIYFNWIKNNDKLGTFKYELNDQELSKIDDLLSKVDVNTLRESYTSHRNDMQIYSTRFLIGKKEKEVLFYDDEAPVNYESLIDYLISLGDNSIKEIDKTLNVKTREKVKILDISIPPLPNQ